MAPDLERLARTPWPIARCAYSGTRLFNSALARSCSRNAGCVRVNAPANSAQASETLISAIRTAAIRGFGGRGWFVATSFAFTPPDGSRNGGQFTPNPDYWTFEPALAISYLGSNWVASANFFYDINTKSQSNCCAKTDITSGNALYGDLTAVWKVGEWSIGPVGYFEVQTTADTGNCNPAPGVNLCGRYETAAAGGLIGYDFGPVDLQVWVTDSFVGRDTPQGAGGLNVWSRIGFKLWGFEAPPVAPLVSKQ